MNGGSMVNWQRIMARHKHLDEWRDQAMQARDWSTVDHIDDERERLPHIGWLRTEPWTDSDRTRVTMRQRRAA